VHSVLFCLLSLTLTVPRAGADEVGGDPQAPAVETLSLPRIDVGLALTLGYRVFDDQDMDQTYGGLPTVGVEASFTIAGQAVFFAGVGYGRRDGDPYYDRPDFTGGSSTLKVVPVTLGLRGDFSSNAQLGLLGVFGVEAAWVEERVPGAESWAGAADEAQDGWIRGIYFAFGPELRSADRSRAAGLLFRIGGAEGDLGGRYDSHGVNLTGMGVRFHFTHTFGRGGAS
jgi:hypothetical protein